MDKGKNNEYKYNGHKYNWHYCFSKPQIAVEVKWGNKLDNEDIRKAEDNLSKVDAKEKWPFVQDKKMVKQKTTLKVWI